MGVVCQVRYWDAKCVLTWYRKMKSSRQVKMSVHSMSERYPRWRHSLPHLISECSQIIRVTGLQRRQPNMSCITLACTEQSFLVHMDVLEMQLEDVEQHDQMNAVAKTNLGKPQPIMINACKSSGIAPHLLVPIFSGPHVAQRLAKHVNGNKLSWWWVLYYYMCPSLVVWRRHGEGYSTKPSSSDGCSL